jgi:hypothetical protein
VLQHDVKSRARDQLGRCFDCHVILIMCTSPLSPQKSHHYHYHYPCPFLFVWNYTSQGLCLGKVEEQSAKNLVQLGIRPKKACMQPVDSQFIDPFLA